MGIGCIGFPGLSLHESPTATSMWPSNFASTITHASSVPACCVSSPSPPPKFPLLVLPAAVWGSKLTWSPAVLFCPKDSSCCCHSRWNNEGAALTRWEPGACVNPSQAGCGLQASSCPYSQKSMVTEFLSFLPSDADA